MSLVKTRSEAEYYLLSNNSRQSLYCKDYLVIIACLLVLLCATYMTLFLAWRTAQDDSSDNLDFMLYGPSRNQLDFLSFQQQRAEFYAKVNHDKDHSLPPPAIMSEVYVSEEMLRNSPFSRVTPQPDGFRLVCYYSMPSSPGSVSTKQLMPEDIDPTLCTHINLAFAVISNNSVVPQNSYDVETYNRIVGLKKKTPNLKVLLSVNSDMSDMVTNHTTRKVFIHSCMETLKKFDMDGIDLDWEFPTNAWTFMKLLAELRESFGSHYLLTVAVAAPQPIVDLSYKIDVMARYVDWVNLMTYDFHYYARYIPVTGLNAPLYSSSNEHGYWAQLNSNWSVNYWDSQGMPRSKIVLGVPTYGHTYGLMNSDNNGIGAPASGFGTKGGSSGFINYPDVCQFLQEGATEESDRKTRVPYAYKDKDWISFDDDRSVAYKAEYVTSKGLAGVMIWSLNADDFEGRCSETKQKFPLITRVKEVLNNDEL